MAKDVLLTVRVEPELHQAFMAAAAAMDRPGSQIIREMIRDFVEQRHDRDSYDAWLAQKVAEARADIAAGRTLSNEEVEARAAARRARLLKQVAEESTPEQVAHWMAAEPNPSDEVKAAIETAKRRHAKQAGR